MLEVVFTSAAATQTLLPLLFRPPVANPHGLERGVQTLTLWAAVFVLHYLRGK